MGEFNSLSDDVVLGDNVVLTKFINLYGCSIGDNSKLGTFIEVQRNVTIGRNCKISSHTFICEGVTIEDNCFVGHGVMFINDKYPRSTNSDGELEGSEWKERMLNTKIKTGTSIGSNATIMGGVKIGKNVLVGAGSVVTKNIPDNEVWAGNPAKFIRKNS
jgi:UDP-2-acetamido-3-amino-2,3-dideoxy-glucuronate N-acetyltransferase